MMTKNSGCYRQGDVFIIPATSEPKGNRSSRGQVLAFGEVTGHSHRVKDPLSASIFTSGGQLFMEVTGDSGSTVVHDEHGPIDVPQGLYEIRIQREYTPRAIVRVVD